MGGETPGKQLEKLQKQVGTTPSESDAAYARTFEERKRELGKKVGVEKLDRVRTFDVPPHELHDTGSGRQFTVPRTRITTNLPIQKPQELLIKSQPQYGEETYGLDPLARPQLREQVRGGPVQVVISDIEGVGRVVGLNVPAVHHWRQDAIGWFAALEDGTRPVFTGIVSDGMTKLEVSAEEYFRLMQTLPPEQRRWIIPLQLTKNKTRVNVVAASQQVALLAARNASSIATLGARGTADLVLQSLTTQLRKVQEAGGYPLPGAATLQAVHIMVDPHTGTMHRESFELGTENNLGDLATITRLPGTPSHFRRIPMQGNPQDLSHEGYDSVMYQGKGPLTVLAGSSGEISTLRTGAREELPGIPPQAYLGTYPPLYLTEEPLGAVMITSDGAKINGAIPDSDIDADELLQLLWTQDPAALARLMASGSFIAELFEPSDPRDKHDGGLHIDDISVLFLLPDATRPGATRPRPPEVTEQEQVVEVPSPRETSDPLLQQFDTELQEGTQDLQQLQQQERSYIRLVGEIGEAKQSVRSQTEKSLARLKALYAENGPLGGKLLEKRQAIAETTALLLSLTDPQKRAGAVLQLALAVDTLNPELQEFSDLLDILEALRGYDQAIGEIQRSLLPREQVDTALSALRSQISHEAISQHRRALEEHVQHRDLRTELAKIPDVIPAARYLASAIRGQGYDQADTTRPESILKLIGFLTSHSLIPDTPEVAEIRKRLEAAQTFDDVTVRSTILTNEIRPLFQRLFPSNEVQTQPILRVLDILLAESLSAMPPDVTAYLQQLKKAREEAQRLSHEMESLIVRFRKVQEEQMEQK